MEFLLKPLTEAASYIYLSGIFMIILGALIGLTPPDSRKTLHTGLAIPLFISVGLIYIFRSFDFFVGIGGFTRINAILQGVVIFCGIELGRSNFEYAYGKQKFSWFWYIPLLLFFIFLNYEYDYTKRIIINVMLMLAKLFSVIVTIKAAKILSEYNRNTIRGGFYVAFWGAILHFFIDMPFAAQIDGHYKTLPQNAIYLYYLESLFFFIISIFILIRRYIYERSQRLHLPNTISLLSPVVVYVTSIVIALGVLIGSNLITEQEKSKQNLESQSFNLNIKNAISQRFDFAISSARFISENPLVSMCLTNMDHEIIDSLRKYLVTFNNENPNLIALLLDSKGNVMISSENNSFHEGKNFSAKKYFTDGIKGISGFSVLKNESDKSLELYAYYPVFSSIDNQIIGVVVLRVKTEELENLIKLNRYPTMIIDINNNGRVMISNVKDYLNQNLGDLKEFINKETQNVSKIPILASLTKHNAFFYLSSISSFEWCILTLSNISQNATTQVWLLFIALLITFILYIIQYGIAYNSENLKTIEAAQSNFQLIFNNTPEPICVISEDTTTILAINKSMQNTFGYEDTLIGKKLDDMIVDNSSLKYNIPSSEDMVVSECNFKKANGDTFVAELTASHIDYASKGAILLNIHDISLFKKIEEKLIEAKNSAEEANQIKSRLLANASHELRTPMTAIIGLSELAVSVCHDENQRQIVELLRISSKSLMSLINDMFNLTEIQNGKVKISKFPFKLNNLIDEVIEYVSFLSKRDNKNIVFRTVSNLPELVSADLDHMRQTLLAIIDYASDICVNNNTLVNIDFDESSEDFGNLIFIISGVNQEYDEEILRCINNDIDLSDPYHASATRKFASGIALYAMIIKNMGGTIIIEKEGKIPNTISIKLEFPLTIIKKDKYSGAIIYEERPFFYKGKALNFLIADDNDVNLFFVESIINRFKGLYHSVRDGSEVIEVLKEKDFDVILLDIQMPKMNGMTALKEIRKLSGKKSEIPVIAISAFASEDEKAKVLAAGAQKYLGKPFFPKDLHEAVASVFELDKEISNKESEKTKEEPNADIIEHSEEGLTEVEKSIIKELKRIDYSDFKLRLAPNAKNIIKLEEIYNRRYASLDIEIDNCINENDSLKLREVAHSIKGLVGMMSSKETWEIAKDIEKSASENNIEKAISRIGELRFQLAEISDDLKIIKEYLK